MSSQYQKLYAAACAYVTVVAQINQSLNSEDERVELMHEAKASLDKKVAEINKEHMQ